MTVVDIEEYKAKQEKDTPREVTLYTFSNKEERPHLEALLRMFYEGAFRNHIGISEAFDREAKEEVLLLVGVTKDEKGEIINFPIARCLKAEEVVNFLGPDGKGGWVGNSDEADTSNI